MPSLSRSFNWWKFLLFIKCESKVKRKNSLSLFSYSRSNDDLRLLIFEPDKSLGARLSTMTDVYYWWGCIGGWIEARSSLSCYFSCAKFFSSCFIGNTCSIISLASAAIAPARDLSLIAERTGDTFFWAISFYSASISLSLCSTIELICWCWPKAAELERDTPLLYLCEEDWPVGSMFGGMKVQR